MVKKALKKYMEVRVKKDGVEVEVVTLPIKPIWIVGRQAEKCDLVLTHGSLSRQHCALNLLDAGALQVTDLGSSNGTTVNGEKLQPNVGAILNDNDVVVFGESTRSYQFKTIVSTKAILNEELKLEGHTKAVCAVSVDVKGSRFVTGCYDYQIRLFDFGGMKSTARPFKGVIAQEGYPILSLSFSPSGGQFLAIPSSSQGILFTREGDEITKTAIGDPYLRDASKQKGHAGSLTCGEWHRSENKLFITGSADGTCRSWDIDGKQTLMDNHIICSGIFKTFSKGTGLSRNQVTACHWDAGRIFTGCSDGTIQIFNLRGGSHIGFMSRPSTTISTLDSGVSCVKTNDYHLGIRTASHLQMWDTRSLKKSVWDIEDLKTSYSETNFDFSPDGKLMVTAGAHEELLFCDTATGDIVNKRSLGSNAIVVQWHKGLNQLFLGCANGQATILFDYESSNKGALSCVNRFSKTSENLFMSSNGSSISHDKIFLPNALPMYRMEEDSVKSDAEIKRAEYIKARKNPITSKQPSRGPSLPGDNFKGKNSFSAHVMQERIGIVASKLTEDPRDSLLQQAHKKSKLDFGTTSVYQTKTLLAEKTMEQEEQELHDNKNN